MVFDPSLKNTSIGSLFPSSSISFWTPSSSSFENLLIFVRGWLTWQLFPKPIAKEGLLKPSLKVNNLVFHQTPQQEDCNNHYSQNLHNHQLLIHFFFKITSSGVAYFCKSEGVHLTEMSIQSKISFWNSTDLGSLTGNAQCGNFKL